ncbi:MAG: hypothetical protein ACR2MO_03040 [Acidimicrobiales bacterium]
MRSRAPAAVAVVVFALAVALVAVFAGQGGGDRLVKLPAGSSTGTAADEAAPALGALSTRSALAYPGSFEYKVDGTLPELPSKAPGFRLGSASTAAGVARLAASLGVVGDVQADATGWRVRAGDRELRVERIAGLPWYVGPACPDTPVSSEGGDVASCAVAVDTAMPMPAPAEGGPGGSGQGCTAEGCVDEGVCPPNTDCLAPPAPLCEGPTVKCAQTVVVDPCEPGTVCSEPAPLPAPACPPDTKCVEPPAPGCASEPCDVPVPVEEPPRPADLPSEAEARTLAREAFARLGVATDGMVVEDGWVAWYARVETRVDGLAVIGMDTSLSIGAKGEVVGGNGFLAVPERIGDYPLIGAEAGLRRLAAGTWAGGPARDLVTTAPATEVGAVEPGVAPCGDPAVSCLPEPPTPIVQTVTGAHLALMFLGDALVPAYVFELADGGSVPVPAVTDEWLDKESTGLGR